MTVNSPLASPSATIELLQRYGLGTRKSLGQHFLIDDGVIGRILRLAKLEPDDSVLEIGPGIGTLTEALLAKGQRVFAIEKDHNLLSVLANIRQRYPGSFDYINADAIEAIAPAATRSGAAIATISDKLAKATTLVANLPYAIAATVVLDCFQLLPNLRSATVMVQKEVADRMAAKPGSKDFGGYSVKLQLLTCPQGSFAVSRNSFLPPPRVDSTVLRISRRDDAIEPQAVQTTFFIIDAAFAERRKTIRNSMRSYFLARQARHQAVDELLEQAGVSGSLRGEALGVEDFRHLGTAAATLQIWPMGCVKVFGQIMPPNPT